MANLPTWKTFRATICGLKAEGEAGFEGLVRRLFEVETGFPFYLARKGDQPAADANSPKRGIALEAKRYDRSTIPDDKIIGEIDRALSELPSLDVFVVAATKALGQLAPRLEQKAQDTGLDILPLSLGDAMTDFGALCAAHWDAVENSSPHFSSEWRDWAACEAAKPETQAKLALLRKGLSGLATQRFVSEKCRLLLEPRFRGKGAGERVHNRVILDESVERSGVQSKLRDWWSQSSTPIGVLEGQEGTGKTWVAASFVQGLMQSEQPVAVWLDSRDWTGIQDVEGLVAAAMRTVFPGDSALRQRLLRKVFNLWPEPVLFVLDGANERGAWEAADRLLNNFAAHSNRFTSRVRLLFTSRPLTGRPGIRRDFWSSQSVIQVGNFDAHEFATALAKRGPQSHPESLPAVIRDLAVIPRYFCLCVRLGERLKSFKSVTKQVLLWMDLEDKIANGDPQTGELVSTLNLTPAELLSQLAQLAGWSPDAQPTLATEGLMRTMPDFLKVRADLKEQRIILDATHDTTTLRSEHVTLGWALVLKQRAEQNSAKSVDELRDILLVILEPAASNDDKVKALHTAALLTLVGQPIQGNSVRNIRTALFSLWIEHHNASVDDDSLNLFARQDVEAYTRAVEILFRDYLSGHVETGLIEPLARNWRDTMDGSESTRTVLERWLKFIYPGGASGSKEGDVVPPADLVVAESAQQLRLSYAAIGVISFRPTPELLPALLACNASCTFCYVDLHHGGMTHRHSVKSSSDPLGVLLRWGYTEAVLPQLKARVPHADADDLLWFARLFRQVTIPGQIGEAQDIIQYFPATKQNPATTLKAWLSTDPPSDQLHLGFGIVGHSAVRRDLPTLTTAEVSRLGNDVLERVKSEGALSARSQTLEHRDLEALLPWLARYSPAQFREAWRILWRLALASNDPQPAFFDLKRLIPGDDGSELVQFVLAEKHRLSGLPGFDWFAVPLSELMLFHASPAQLMEWLHLLADKVVGRTDNSIICILPLPHAFRALAPAEIADSARRQFDVAYASCLAAPSDRNAKRAARFWLGVYSYVVKPAKEIGEWALQLAEVLGSDDEFRFPLFNLISNCGNLMVLDAALCHPAFRSYQLGYHSWRWASAFERETPCPYTFKELEEKASFTVSGRLLHQSSQDEELRNWGHAISRYALEALTWCPPSPLPKTRFMFRMDETGNFAGHDFEGPKPGGTQWHDVSSPVWGVDRQTNTPSPEQKDFDLAVAQYRTDLETLRKSSRRELVEFNAAGALHRWSQLEPGAFSEFAESFLSLLWRREMNETWDLGRFAHAVATCLIRQRPKAALQFTERCTTGDRITLLDFYSALAWESREIWSQELNTQAEAKEVRMELLLRAPHDEALLWQVQAAHGCGNARELAQIAANLLEAEVARDRALGVTLLAFQGDQTALSSLNERRSSDASFWIRDYAAWAWEVCALEHACRERYREALTSASLAELSCVLAEISPALSPMALAWRDEIEREEGWESEDRRTRTYLDLFWYHWTNGSSKRRDVEVMQRKLRNYCRGETLKTGVTDHLAPWWVISNEGGNQGV